MNNLSELIDEIYTHVTFVGDIKFYLNPTETDSPDDVFLDSPNQLGKGSREVTSAGFITALLEEVTDYDTTDAVVYIGGRKYPIISDTKHSKNVIMEIK